MIGKKWIYLERNALHRQSVGISEGERGTRVWGLSVFTGVGNFIGNEWEECSSYFWGERGGDFQELGHSPLFDRCGSLELSWRLWVRHLAC